MRTSLLFVPALVAAGVLGLAPAVAAQRESPFMEQFRALMKVNAQEEMGPLLKRNELAAILAVIETCEAINAGSNDVLETEIDALGKAWRRTYDSRFVEHVYDYFSMGLKGTFKKHREQLIDRYLVKRREFEPVEKEKNSPKFSILAAEFRALGDQFTEVGDQYMAAQSYLTAAVCYDDGLNDATHADFRRAYEHWGLFLAARDKIDLVDKVYSEAKAHFEKLGLDGYGEPAMAPEGGATPPAEAVASAPAVKLATAFEVVPDIEAIERPLYAADSNFQLWNSVDLQGVDSSAPIPGFEGSPKILRTGPSKAAVDVDGDGQGDVEIPLTGKITPVRVELGSASAPKPWAFLAVIGQEQDVYQGFKYNLGPTDELMRIFVAGASSLAADVNGVRVRLIDDNLDGQYGGEPKPWVHPGLLEGVSQHDIDSIVVGEAKAARPWSRLQEIGDGWFEFRMADDGVSLIATRTDVKSGTLQLDFKDLTPSWLVVRGTGEAAADLFYEVVNGGTKQVRVPAGSYQLFAGLVSEGKKSQMAKALVLPGRSTRAAWTVTAGGTTKLELGAPFGLDFDVTQDAETVKVEGATIVVTGRGGETYQRLWNCVLSPEVNVRRAGSSRGKKEQKLVPVSSQEELEVQKYDFRTAWFPMGEPFQKTIPEETFEVQLFEKKNKLFGKIESDWKAD